MSDHMSDKFEEQRRKYKFAPLYSTLYIMLRDVANANGYALAIHGSMARDCDLLAVPWTIDAIAPHKLVAAMCAGMQVHDGISGPEEMPHRRLAWAIAVGAGAYIDLSVLPVDRSPSIFYRSRARLLAKRCVMRVRELCAEWDEWETATVTARRYRRTRKLQNLAAKLKEAAGAR